MLRVLQQHLLRAQQVMKRQADNHRREVEYVVGDWVFLKLRPYKQQSLARRSNEKLAAHFYGPYEIEAKIGAVAYRLKLPPGTKIHPTFHVSQLKPAVGSSLVPVSLPSQLTVEGVLEAEPEAFMGTRTNSITGQEEVLIKWKNAPDCDSSWEWKAVIQDQFPHFNLENKVNFKERGNVSSEITKAPILY